MDGSPTITEDDLVGLSRRQMVRVAATARGAAWALLGLAAVLALGWLWVVARNQGLFANDDPESFTPMSYLGGQDLGLLVRVDLFVSSLATLAFSALVAGLGVLLWLLSEWATLQAGGSLTGWEVGDEIDEPEDDAWAPPADR